MQGGSTNIMAFTPRIDGDTIPKNPLEAINAGESNVDLIVGSNLNEWRLFSFLIPEMSKMDYDSLYNMAQMMLGFLGPIDQGEDRTKQLINKYKEAREGIHSTAPEDIMDAIATDFIFRIPATRVAEAHNIHHSNTYNYLFTWPSPAFKGRLGSCHAVEIPFVFRTIDLPRIDEFVGKGPDAKTLSEKMMKTWITFARTGNPNHDDIPDWPSYNAKTRSTMMIGSEFKVVNAIFENERAAWDGII